MSGIYLVGLPIGNNEDITLRALRTLREAEYIYCEDTRVFKELCKHIDISIEGKRIESFHDHSNQTKVEKILETAKTAKCAFVSDAGSPMISDPAYPLVKAAIKMEVDVYNIPGVSSVTTALECSALPPIPFHFHGFLGRDKADLAVGVETILSQYGTHLFFEGKSRVVKTLEFFTSKLPDSEFVVARELTKEFESIYRFKGSDYQQKSKDIVIKGEFVILVYNHQKNTTQNNAEVNKLVEDIFKKGAKPKLVAKLLSELTDKTSKEIYEILGQTRQ